MDDAQTAPNSIKGQTVGILCMPLRPNKTLYVGISFGISTWLEGETMPESRNRRCISLTEGN